MRALKITVSIVFVLTTILFGAYYCYDRLNNDHVAPEIHCSVPVLQVNVSASDRALCAGLTATDNRDGDITDRIIVRSVTNLYGSNSANVNYVVFDSSSNYCVFSRRIEYLNYRKPHFSLSQPLIYPTGSTVGFMDRLTADSGALDQPEDISSKIRLTSGAIINYLEGQYPVTLQVTNALGDTSTISLTVRIQNVSSRQPVLYLQNYIAYVSAGENVEPEDFRNYLTIARTSAYGESVDFNDVTIDGTIDTSTRGCNEVTFSYTNAEGLVGSVVLTVVVE